MGVLSATPVSALRCGQIGLRPVPQKTQHYQKNNIEHSYRYQHNFQIAHDQVIGSDDSKEALLFQCTYFSVWVTIKKSTFTRPK